MSQGTGGRFWTTAASVLGAVALVLGASRCSNTDEGMTREEAVQIMMALMSDAGMDGGAPPGDAGGGADAGSGRSDAGAGDGGAADGGNSLCSRFTPCNSDADCVNSPDGPSCTPCPACGRHCWSGQPGAVPDGGDCTKCICVYGKCYYNSDCPTGTTCNTTTNKCVDGGTEFPTIFKGQCDSWIASGSVTCNYSQVVPEGANYTTSECGNVNLQFMGHSSSGQCNPTINAAFSLCLQGCAVTVCNNGCSTFQNQDDAMAQFEACRSALDEMGFYYDVTVIGNQALSGCGRETHMQMSCVSGFPTVVSYGTCDPNKNCYFIGQTSKCTQADGGTADQVCCAAGGGDPKWQIGARACTQRTCNELKDGGTCWGENNPTTTTCTTPTGGQGQVTCCKTDGGAAGWIDHGVWKDNCN